MPEASFACPKCKTAFGIDPGTEHVAASCPQCASVLEGFFFPAFFRAAPTGAAASALVDHTEASCFYHSQKQAVGICDGCGRMICALCSIELGSEHLCPNCISSGKKKGKITSLENNRICYDNIALGLALVGAIPFCWSNLSIILAPIAIYISIRHWNSHGSLLGTRKWRFVVAIILSLAEFIFGAVVIALIVIGLTHPLHHQ